MAETALCVDQSRAVAEQRPADIDVRPGVDGPVRVDRGPQPVNT